MLPRFLVHRLIYPLHERLRGRSTRTIAALYRTHDRGTAAQLQLWHQDQLMAHLQHAVQQVPWYRERVALVQSPDDLALFPLLDKQQVRSAGLALAANAFSGRLIPLATGGSSGEPLKFWSDATRESSQLAAKLRSRAWFGLHAGHRETDLWGSPIELAAHARMRRLSAWALGVRLLPAFSLNDATMERFAAALRGTDLLYGYASALARYARFLQQRGEQLERGAIKLVISTAEVLLDADRAIIKEAFGAPVANEFGSRDGGLIAHECPRGALHVQHDAVHVEILRSDGSAAPPGESGEVVVTNLWARGYPLIRYRTGDRAAWSMNPCACGLPHPTLAALEGRMTDSLVRDDGTRVHGLALIYILREQPGVQRFRCTQRADRSLFVEVVAAPGTDHVALEALVRRGVARVLGIGTAVLCGFPAELAPLPGGKHRFILCEVPEEVRAR